MRQMLASRMRTAFEGLLTRRAAAWEQDDLMAFCGSYTDDAVLITIDGLFLGKHAIEEGYRAQLGASFGVLRYELLEVRFPPSELARRDIVSLGSALTRYHWFFSGDHFQSGFLQSTFIVEEGEALVVHESIN